ncbi:MAG: 50S ribosomal protein L25 [Spirochaetales bacterium]
MEQVTLAFQERADLKKSASRRLRLAGRIPAVVYGQGTKASISVDAHEFGIRFASFGENTVIKLQSGKTSYEVLVKDYQDNVLTNEVQHIDFYHISATKTLHTNVPVHVTGSAIGVRNGGLLETVVHELEVECLAKDIPHSIVVDVAALEIGNSIKVGDIVAPSGVKILSSPDAVVVHVISTHGLADVPEAAEAAPAAEAVAAAPAKDAAAAKAPAKA